MKNYVTNLPVEISYKILSNKNLSLNGLLIRNGSEGTSNVIRS